MNYFVNLRNFGDFQDTSADSDIYLLVFAQLQLRENVSLSSATPKHAAKITKSIFCHKMEQT